jgi:hypothetical protein
MTLAPVRQRRRPKCAASRRVRLERLLEHPGIVPAIAAVGALVWFPNIGRPLTPDEGGFLMVGAQWAPGSSLYGDYWVDRPPLLIGLFQAAALAGGQTALRILGLLAVVVSVLLAGRVGQLAVPGGGRAPVLAVATAAVFLTTPLFGATEVDGELLAVPFVLTSVMSLLRALQFVSPAQLARRRRWSWWMCAGATAMAAALVKQNALDGFVLALTALLWVALHHRQRATGAALAFASGAGGCLLAALVWAASRGTWPGGLWRAVVVFRADAAAVISAEASAATPARAHGLALSFAASGAILLLIVGFLPGRRAGRVPGRRPKVSPRVDVRILAATALTWEALGVGLGGSYWLHYLVALVPGLVLTAAAVGAQSLRRVRWAAAGLAYALVATVVATEGNAVQDHAPRSDMAVARYLRGHRRTHDTGVVAFGDPAILEAAGLPSPYPQLWSLPVRVLDPDLAAFTGVLAGPQAPTWAVVRGTSLDTWGVDGRRAQLVFDREYRLVHVEGDYHVFISRRGRPAAASVG